MIVESMWAKLLLKPTEGKQMLKKNFNKLNMYALCLASTLSAADIIPPTPPVETYVPKMGKNWKTAQRIGKNGKLETLKSFTEECRAADRTNNRKQRKYQNEIAEYNKQKKATDHN